MAASGSGPVVMPSACRRREAFRAALAALGLAALGLGAPAAGPGLKLHVPSPDWRDQIIYFVVTDRFADGDPGNNDQGAGEFGAGQRSRYNGGDLRGLVQRLDYIRGLGATALWITPPVANQWIDPVGGYTGYHGYWAENFVQVDRHLGTLLDYQRLSHALHSAGMYLVQDIVLNHTGNYFSYGPDWSASDPARDYRAHTATSPRARPSQPPFDQNDPRDPWQRRAAIYHWTPDVSDFTDPAQEHSRQVSGLDDLNSENPQVRRALRSSYGHWIKAVGVDAFRVDTAFYMPPDYFRDFLRASDKAAPGINEVARRSGRRDFHVFGEGFAIDRPFEDVQARKIESYMNDAAGRPLLPGMLNFPLYGALGDVFARGHVPAELGYRIERTMSLHARPHHMVNFVDNHDVDRFLAAGSEPALRQALLALMTLPGIPAIYYGTEQGLREPRAAMFSAGWASGGRDRYDTQAPLYRTIAALSRLRQSNKLFSRGLPQLLRANPARPGALAWRMNHAGESALVVFNTADSETLLDNLETGLPQGTVLLGLYGVDAVPATLVVGAGGRITLPLAARFAAVWKMGLPAQAAAGRQSVSLGGEPGQGALLALAPGVASRFDADFEVTGSAPPGLSGLRLVVDGDLAGATALVPDASGRWQARVATAHMTDPAVTHSLTVWAPGHAAAASRDFQVQRRWQLVADVEDPPGDDRGPLGRYVYPSDPTWGERRQGDLRRVRVFQAGPALRLDVVMNQVTTSWNPALGFDHVAFTIFIELPGREGGATVMPLQNAALPPGMRWHLRLRANGWASALFDAVSATASHEGTPVASAARVQVDAAQARVSFTLPAQALGNPMSLSGARIYVTTWDYDGGYRALAPAGAPFAFGGGAAGDAKVLDDSAIITLP